MHTQSEGLFARLLETVSRWQQRGRDRELLARMTERQRCDIGLSTEAVDYEINKPFWRA